jgi:hypothetical protein
MRNGQPLRRPRSVPRLETLDERAAPGDARNVTGPLLGVIDFDWLFGDDLLVRLTAPASLFPVDAEPAGTPDATPPLAGAGFFVADLDAGPDEPPAARSSDAATATSESSDPMSFIDVTAGLTGVLDGPLELPGEPVRPEAGPGIPADSQDRPRGGPPDILTVAPAESADLARAATPSGMAWANDQVTAVPLGGGFSPLLSEEPEVSIEAKDPNASEAGTSTGAFVVTLSKTADTDLDVDYTVSGTATSGTDYGTLSGIVTLSFPGVVAGDGDALGGTELSDGQRGLGEACEAVGPELSDGGVSPPGSAPVGRRDRLGHRRISPGAGELPRVTEPSST